MKKKLSILLMTVLLSLAVLPPPAQAAQSETLRVGLAYKDSTTDTTVTSAGLKNKVGSGFFLGRYDDQRQLVSLGWTDQTNISVLITQNLYLTDSGGYSRSAGSSGAVGCFHVQLPGSYADFSAARAVADTVENGFVAWINGTYYVRVGSYISRSAAQEAVAAVEGATLGETSGYGFSVVPTGSSRILFQFDADAAGETGAFGVWPITGEREKGETVYNGNRSYYGGFRFERVNAGNSTVVNMVDREDYLKGVVPYEMSASWPLEALKAQAVCARTYASGSARHSDGHFDLCPTTHCQAYKGTSGAGESSDRAVEETAGLMLYYQGKRIDAVYYSSNGGASEDAKNVWGTDHGYLKGKLDPYEEYATQFMTTSQLSYYRWSKTYTESALRAKLNADGRPCGEIVELRPKFSATGNVIALTVVDVTGKSYTFDRERVRTYFGLNSIRFTVTTTGGGAQGGYAIAGAAGAAADLSGLYAIGGDGTVAPLPGESYVVTQNGVEALEPAAEQTGTGEERVFTLNGTGWGHNVGMSQWGAYAMAKQGFGYQDILRFYYTDITIE